MNTKQSNREKYPEIAEFVDRLRDVFGEVKVIGVWQEPHIEGSTVQEKTHEN